MFFLENLVIFLFVISIFFIFILWLNVYINEKTILISFVIYILSIFSLTIFPGSLLFNNYSYLFFSGIFFSYFFYYFSFRQIFEKKFFLNKADNILIFLSIIFFVTSLIINYNDYIKYSGLLKIFLFISSIIFFVTILPRHLSNTAIYNKFIEFIIWVGLVTSLIAIINTFIGFNNFQQFGYNITISYFRHPNTAAFIYTLSLISCVYSFLFKENSKFKKYFYLLCSILILYGMLFTYSRAGYLAIFIGMSTLLFYYKKRLLLYIAGITLIIGTYIVQNFLFVKGTASLFSRFGLIYSAVEMIKSSNKILLFGVGSVSVFDYYTEFKNQILDSFFLDPVQYPHNFILFYILQFGILSLIPILIYLSLVLFNCFFLIYKNIKKYKFLILPFAVVLSLLFQSLLEDTILFPEYFVYPLFLTFLGIIIFNLKKYRLIKNNEL
jgi:hypothetical protein